MTEYPLYLESGPRRKTTMVHVIELLGCFSRGQTTEAALEATPEAIRSYIGYLAGCGEALDPEAAFTTRIEAHVMEGPWIGYGDPAPGFSPDFEPLEPGDLEKYRRRLGWLHRDLAEYAGDLPPFILEAEPESGRSIYRILQHAAHAEATYLRYQLGHIPGHKEALKLIGAGPEALGIGLSQVFQISERRIVEMSADEMTKCVPHGQVVWSARRMMRRMLEHGWEHLMEVRGRV